MRAASTSGVKCEEQHDSQRARRRTGGRRTAGSRICQPSRPEGGRGSSSLPGADVPSAGSSTRGPRLLLKIVVSRRNQLQSRAVPARTIPKEARRVLSPREDFHLYSSDEQLHVAYNPAAHVARTLHGWQPLEKLVCKLDSLG